jgi:hypothetical protein
MLRTCYQLNKRDNMCIHTEVENNTNVTHVHANPKLKKAITIKPSIQIKFALHHYLSYDKILKIRPHLQIF